MTRKNKILTVSISLLLVLVLIVVLSSTVFCVKNIEVNFLNSTKNLTATQSEIISASEIKVGTNVFFVAKGQAKEKLEKKFPYVNVVNIETIFPNKIIMHLAEREETYALQMNDSYFLVDSDFKVLKVFDGNFSSTQENAIKITGDFSFDATQGDFLQTSGTLLAFKTLEQSFLQNCTDEEKLGNLARMKSLLKSATFTQTKIVFETHAGYKIEIYNPSYKQQQKIAMLNTQIALLEDGTNSGTIYVGNNSSGEVVGSYSSH